MPTSTATALAAFTAVALVPGLPLALLVLRRARPAASVVWVVAAGLGLVTWLSIGIPAVHHGRFDRTTLVAAGTAVAVVAWIPARRHVALLRPRRPGWLTAVLIGLGVVAVALRDDPVYFAYQIADFGEYVNRANHIADGGRFGGWFVNGFPLLLGESNLLLGEARTPDVLPFVGLLMGAGILATLAVGGAARVVVAGAAVPIALHVHSVWFSQFPASETLYATLLVLVVLLAALALRADDRLVATVAGGIGFLLVVARGNGALLLPVAVIGIVLAPAFAAEARARLLRIHLVALTGALWIGTLYDARFNPRYFLHDQAAPRMPDALARWVVRLDEPHVAGAATLGVVAVLGAAVGAGWILDRVLRRRGQEVGLRRVVVVALVGGVLVAHLVVFDVDQFLPRYEALGPLIWVAAMVAAVVAVLRVRSEGTSGFLVLWPLTVGLLLATFQASRMRTSTTFDATWFLYWDRYFFSEAFPMLLLGGAMAVGLLLDAARTSHRRWATPAVLVVAGLVLVVGVLDVMPATLRATERAMFPDAYEDLAALDRLMPDGLPIVYDGVRGTPDGFVWHNTSRALADPLVETFGRDILNQVGPLDPDPTPSGAGVRRQLQAAGAPAGYVLQVRMQPAWEDLDVRGLEVDDLGEVELRFPHLQGRRFLDLEDQPWAHSQLHARVLRVDLEAAAA